MAKELTDEEFVQRLIENGWYPEDASKELARLDEDLKESGMDF